MTTVRGSSRGVSMIEVLVALVILVVGIFSAVQLQAIALRNTANADALNRTTRVVRGELEWQRYTTNLEEVFELGEPQDCTAVAGLDDSFDRCTVTVEQCSLTFPEGGGRGSLACGGGNSGAFFAVSVDAIGPRNRALELSTLWTGVYISGGALGEEGDAQDNGGDD